MRLVHLGTFLVATAVVASAPAAAQRSTQGGGRGVGGLGSSTSAEELPRAAVDAVLADAHQRLAGCYERAARMAPDVAGELTLVLTIDGAGEVVAARVEDDSVDSEVLARCFVNVATELRFPPPQSAPAIVRWPVTVPLKLAPDESAPAARGRTAPPVPADDDASSTAFWTYLGTASLIGVLPGAALGLLLAAPFGVVAAPLWAIVPLVGNYAGAFAAQLLSGVEIPVFWYVLPAVLALAFYPAIYAVGAVPVIDQIGRGQAFPLEAPVLGWPGAATLAVGLLLVGETLTVTSAAMYAAAADDEGE